MKIFKSLKAPNLWKQAFIPLTIFVHKFYCWCGWTGLYHALCLGSSICTLLYYCESDKTGLMWSAGTTYNTPPLRLSLQGTRHHLINFLPKLEVASSQKRKRIYCTLLKIIVHKEVPDRPARSEPRVIKRRPKSYPRLTKPRQELRKQLQNA